MPLNIYPINLSLEGDAYRSPIIVRQGDYDSIVFDVHVTNRGQPVNLSGETIIFECVTPAKTFVRDDGSQYGNMKIIEASEGHFQYTLCNEAFSAVGVVNLAYFAFETANSDMQNATNRATTRNFSFVVAKNALEGNLDPADYMSDVQGLMDDINWVKNQYETLNPDNYALVTDLNSLRDSVNSHIANHNNPHQVTKAQVGLGNVDNVQQAEKVDFDNLLSQFNSLSDLLIPTINALATGADPTGANQSAAGIQAALNIAKNTMGCIVYIPNGTYRLEKTLYIYANTILLCAPNAHFIREHVMTCMLVNGGQNGEYADVTGYDGPGGITIIGGYWDNNIGDDQYQDNQNDMFILGHGSNIWIEKVKFIDCISYHCIDMNGCRHVRIRDCAFFGYHDYTTEGVAREAIQIGECNFAEFGVNDFTPCFDVIVEGCLFTKSSKQGYFPAGVGNHYSRNGVRQTDIVVRNNYFEGCTHSGTHPYKWGTTWIYQNTYINCKRAVHCSNVNGDDVSAQNPDGSPSGQPGACENIYIFDNDMINCQSDCVYTSGFIYNGIYAQPKNIVIERNRMTGAGTGLSITLVRDLKVRNNTFNALYRGMWLNSNDHSEIYGNMFETIERECVAADLDTSQTTFNNRFMFIRHNQMFDVGYSAVYMRTTLHGTVSDNEMFNVASVGGTRGGVAIESSDSIRVLNNSIDVAINGSDQFSISIGQGSTVCQSSNNRVNIKQVVDPNGGNFVGHYGVDASGNPVPIPDVV